MIQQRHRTRAALYLVGDVVATLLAFLAAWQLRFGTSFLPHVKSHGLAAGPASIAGDRRGAR